MLSSLYHIFQRWSKFLLSEGVKQVLLLFDCLWVEPLNHQFGLIRLLKQYSFFSYKNVTDLPGHLKNNIFAWFWIAINLKIWQKFISLEILTSFFTKGCGRGGKRGADLMTKYHNSSQTGVSMGLLMGGGLEGLHRGACE